MKIIYQGIVSNQRPSKYRNKITVVNGIKFHSKKEAEYYNQLVIRHKADDLVGFLRQIPIRLPGNVTYWCDFLVFEKDGTMRWVEIKGYDTRDQKNKRKIIEAIYPWIKIEVIH